MTKAELIAKVAQSAQMGKTEANQALNAVLDAVQEALAKEGKVILSGFGMFWTEKKDEHQGRDPRTGETIEVAAAKVPTFAAGKALKDAVQ